MNRASTKRYDSHANAVPPPSAAAAAHWAPLRPRASTLSFSPAPARTQPARAAR